MSDTSMADVVQRSFPGVLGFRSRPKPQRLGIRAIGNRDITNYVCLDPFQTEQQLRQADGEEISVSQTFNQSLILFLKQLQRRRLKGNIIELQFLNNTLICVCLHIERLKNDKRETRQGEGTFCFFTRQNIFLLLSFVRSRVITDCRSRCRTIICNDCHKYSHKQISTDSRVCLCYLDLKCSLLVMVRGKSLVSGKGGRGWKWWKQVN